MRLRSITCCLTIVMTFVLLYLIAQKIVIKKAYNEESHMALVNKYELIKEEVTSFRSDLDKVNFIYDFIISTTEYKRHTVTDTRPSYWEYVILDGEGDCGGLSNYMYELCKMFGIEVNKVYLENTVEEFSNHELIEFDGYYFEMAAIKDGKHASYICDSLNNKHYEKYVEVVYER